MHSNGISSSGQWKTEALATSAGLRAASESDGRGKDSSVRQIVGGAGYEMLDKQLTLRASTELNVGSRGESANFPNRLVLGIDYKLNPQLTVFAQHEVARSGALRADTTRVGMRRSLPTPGGIVSHDSFGKARFCAS